MSANPHPVDIHVGHRIRQRRALLGMNQTDLGKSADITFQQVQKYENGSNRCSSSMLATFAQALDVPVGFFFEDAPVNGGGRTKPLTRDDDPMLKRETLELVRAYYKIPDRKVRKRLFEMTKAIAKVEDAA